MPHFGKRGKKKTFMEYEQKQITIPDADKGYECPCCGQFVKTYHRRLNSSMSCVILLIYRSGKRGFFHVENWLKEIGRSELRADFHKLRYWNLLEKKIEDREDGSGRNGHYKITGRGIMFAEGSLRVQEKAVIFNGKLKYFEGNEVEIKQCLGKRFSYEELMSNN